LSSKQDTLSSTQEELQQFLNKVMEMFDVAFIRGLMQWGLRRQVPIIQMHHAPHVLYNWNHTNKIGVKLQRSGLCCVSRPSEA